MRQRPDRDKEKGDSRIPAPNRDTLVGPSLRGFFALLSVATLFGLACGPGSAPSNGPSDSNSRSASETLASEPDRRGAAARLSQSGRFEIMIRPEAGSVPLGVLHAWIVEVRLPGGEPAGVRQLVFDGGMPQHAHGFETSPRVTDALGPGAFRVDGVRFHMAGDWQIRVDVATEGVADTALFDVRVGP